MVIITNLDLYSAKNEIMSLNALYRYYYYPAHWIIPRFQCEPTPLPGEYSYYVVTGIWQLLSQRLSTHQVPISLLGLEWQM